MSWAEDVLNGGKGIESLDREIDGLVKLSFTDPDGTVTFVYVDAARAHYLRKVLIVYANHVQQETRKRKTICLVCGGKISLVGCEFCDIDDDCEDDCGI